MKELLIVSFVLVILSVIGVYINPFIVVGFTIYPVLFLPVFLIEAITLMWLYKDFSTLKAIYTAFVLYIVSISVYVFMYSVYVFVYMGPLKPHFVVGVISLLLHLYLLKFQFKTNLSIKGVSAFVFAHIVYVICWYIYKYLFPPQAPTITFC